MNLARDNNTGTSSLCNITMSQTWTAYLELDFGRSMIVDKLRYYTGTSTSDFNLMNIDLYYSGAWHSVYNAIHVRNVYTTVNLPSWILGVSKARVRFYRSGLNPAQASLAELQLNEVC